ncbi:VOC family protein [Aestuariivirga litoralis]|uniref:VOC family protein n=1 Tax=Aestuariivirga litoralis TaxID=2650924 RepID=UPI0018C606A7|nr:VOC family protein [Aestuariivirga litoralis]MBG1231504.1 VOC family protein [Aestuariivirga litoralis]
MTMMQHDAWHELNTWEPEAALSFYRSTLGWEFQQTELNDGGGFWLATKDGKTVGAIYELTAPDHDGIPSHWMTYLNVPDMEQAEADAVKAGGEVLRPMMEIPGVGKLSVVTDSTGALIGLIELEAESASRH